MEDTAGKLVSEKKAKKRWIKYIENLYKTQTDQKNPLCKVIEKLETAIKKAKIRNLCGIEGLDKKRKTKLLTV